VARFSSGEVTGCPPEVSEPIDIPDVSKSGLNLFVANSQVLQVITLEQATLYDLITAA